MRRWGRRVATERSLRVRVQLMSFAVHSWSEPCVQVYGCGARELDTHIDTKHIVEPYLYKICVASYRQ